MLKKACKYTFTCALEVKHIFYGKNDSLLFSLHAYLTITNWIILLKSRVKPPRIIGGHSKK